MTTRLGLALLAVLFPGAAAPETVDCPDGSRWVVEDPLDASCVERCSDGGWIVLGLGRCEPGAQVIDTLDDLRDLTPAFAADGPVDWTPAPNAPSEGDPSWNHGLATFGALKYPPDYRHFEYANPEAPKGGSMVLGAIGHFDSLNPFIVKGTPALGLGWMYDTLLRESQDDSGAGYGLLAESVERSPDRSWVAFTLREHARWHDGRPVTPEDVIFSFEILREKGHPRQRSLYRRAKSVEKTGERTVRFHLRGRGNRDTPFKLGTQMPILPEHYWRDRDFAATTLEPPLASGPYRIAEVMASRRIVYERVRDYWGRELAVNVGRFNIDRFQFDYYRDDTVMREAFKSGSLDLRIEGSVKDWMEGYDIDSARDGRIIKSGLTSDNPKPMIAFAINTRRDKFKDIRVRRAINLAFDFEWLNHYLFWDIYTRTDSYFDASDLAAPPLPSGAELEILEGLRDRLPPEIFTEVLELPRSDGRGQNRPNLLEASRLLEAAGWPLIDGRRVRDSTGEPFALEIVITTPALERMLALFVRNLRRIGIDARVVRVDAAARQYRMEHFEFDLMWVWWSQSQTPGAELRSYFGSAAANSPGSFNLAGVREPVVDHLIELIADATDREAFVAAIHALDRVLLRGWHVVPLSHGQSLHILYWNLYSRPPRPKFDPDFPHYWWYDRRKAALLGLDRPARPAPQTETAQLAR